jgi:hypothetical protein
MATVEDRHERAADELIGELLTEVAPAIGNRIHKRVAAGLAALEAAERLASSRAAEPPPAQGEGRDWREVWVVESPHGNPVDVRLTKTEAEAAIANPGELHLRYVPAQGEGRWIRCEERMPDVYSLVQFHVDGWPNDVARFVGRWDGTEWRDDSDTDDSGIPEVYAATQVTRWAPLLPPPPAPESH